MTAQIQTQETLAPAMAPLALDTRLRMERATEAAAVLAKIAEYPPRAQEHALAFLRGIQFAQGIRPSA